MLMRPSILIAAIAFAIQLPAAPALAQSSIDPRSLVSELPFAMAPVPLPRIPAHAVRITDFGARGDGRR